jgi:hypothetical protein
VVCAALIAAAAGCASASDRSSGPLPPLPPAATVPSTAPSTTTPPTTAATPPVSTAARAAPGYTDTTPPPAIDATGTDYAAIAHSLLTYKDWLFAHHPDPALAGLVYQQGTMTYGTRFADLTMVRNLHQTIDSVDLRLTFTVVTVRADLVTLRMRETLVADQWFDQQHRVVRTDPDPVPNHYIVVMTNDGKGRWRIADITQVANDPSIVITR